MTGAGAAPARVVLGEGASDPVYWGPLPDAPSAPKPRRGPLGLLLSPIGIRLLIVAVVAGGGLMLRDFVAGSAADVRVGDCIDLPTTQEVDELQHHPCSQAHGGEVIAVFDYPGGGTYPSEEAFRQAVATRCGAEFATYTGSSFDDRMDLDMTFLTPTPAGWSRGDRELTCIAVSADGSMLNASVKAPAR